MPELPEVETIARNLREGKPRQQRLVNVSSHDQNKFSIHDRSKNDTYAPGFEPSIVGKTIIRAHLLWEPTLAEPSKSEFYERISGQTIHNIGRRGKYLLLFLKQDTLLIHLRMSGDIHINSGTESKAPHDRLILFLDDDRRIAFNDVRKFGRVWLLEDPSSILNKLGPEPFGDLFTTEWLFDALHSRKRQLKPLLLDQSFIAGLGNIYTDEALHQARLHPLTLSNQISKEQTTRLRMAIRNVLHRGIENNGTSIDWVYRGGEFQNQLQVYGRGGKPCFRCGTPIERIVVGQRGTHICPTCQTIQ